MEWKNGNSGVDHKQVDGMIWDGCGSGCFLCYILVGFARDIGGHLLFSRVV